MNKYTLGIYTGESKIQKRANDFVTKVFLAALFIVQNVSVILAVQQ